MDTPQVRFESREPSPAHSPSRTDQLALSDGSDRGAPADVAAKLEKKRLEHERQRMAQQQAFEAQMRALQEQQAAEEAELLASSSSSSSSPGPTPDPAAAAAQDPASASAPVTPPRSPSMLGSSSDEDVDPAAYQRMTQSVADMDRKRASLHTPLDPRGGSQLGARYSPPLQAASSAFGLRSKSKSGTDLPGFSASFTSSQPLAAAAPAPATAAPAPRYATSTVPNSPVAHLNGHGANGHIGSGVRKAAANPTSKSVPGSRRPSDSDTDDGHAATAAAAHMNASLNLADGLGRLSMNGAGPRKTQSGTDAPLLSGFLFDDEMEHELNNPSMGGRYLALNTDDDKFPILVRRDSFPGILSASSAALDLAPLSQTPPRSSGFIRQGHGRNSEWPQFGSDAAAAAAQRPVNQQTGFDPAPLQAPVSPSQSRPLPPPGSGRTSPIVEMSSPGKRSAGLGAIGTPGTPSSPDDYRVGKRNSLAPPGAASPFATNLSSAFNTAYGQYANGSGSSSGGSQEIYASEFGQLGNGFQQAHPHQQSYGQKPYGMRSYNAPSPGNGGPPRQRYDEGNRFAGLRLEDLQGDMHNLCKDQHGCRFLQRKLEEGNPHYRDMIFAEVYPHFAELMVDSFGNYLAQRLLEYSTDEQKNILLSSIHDDIVGISLNIHGTRAIQRLIDHLTTPRQIQTLVSALNLHVVTLIKDLNGNHVIQKCLNSLKPEDNQFIYNAVAASCVEVATHRHGCCVMQRCIDHASESQRIQLVTEITYHCLTLVQDPFSNYVVQYVLEFDRRFVEAIIRQFRGNVCALSCHKFSSNVIEKCIRVADPDGRRMIVGEILERGRLERLVKDLYANYVVQTACDYAEPGQRDQLVQQIRPLLPTIRNTPYGKRIAARIQKATPMAGQRFVSYPMSGGFAYPAQHPYGAPPVLDPAYQQRSFGEQAFYNTGNFAAAPSQSFGGGGFL